MKVTIKRIRGPRGAEQILICLDTRNLPAALAKELERSVVDVVALARRQAVAAAAVGAREPPLYEIEFQHSASLDPLRIDVADGTGRAVQMEALVEEILRRAPPQERPLVRRAG